MEDIYKQILTEAKHIGQVAYIPAIDMPYIKAGATDFGKDSKRNSERYYAAVLNMEKLGLLREVERRAGMIFFAVTDQGYNVIGA